MSKKPKQDSIFKEAWDNMSNDFNNLVPDKLRDKPSKKKFVLWLFIVEIVVISIVGKLIYEWWIG